MMAWGYAASGREKYGGNAGYTGIVGFRLHHRAHTIVQEKHHSRNEASMQD